MLDGLKMVQIFGGGSVNPSTSSGTTLGNPGHGVFQQQKTRAAKRQEVLLWDFGPDSFETESQGRTPNRIPHKSKAY